MTHTPHRFASGADLTDYREQLARERSSRSMILRRSQRPSIAGVLGQSPNVNLIDSSSFPFLDPAHAISTLNSGDPIQIQEFCKQIIGTAISVPRVLTNLLNSDHFISTLDESLLSSLPPQTMVQIMHMMSSIFPHVTKSTELFVDDLIMGIMELLQSSDLQLVGASIALVAVISEKYYARDAILSMGIHIFLIDIASAGNSEQLTLAACEALSQVFANPYPIDPGTISSCVPLLVPLLGISSLPAIEAILACFISLSNKMPAIVFQMYDLKLFSPIVEYLKNEQLVGTALALVGNMSIGDPVHIRTLLGLGVLPILIQLLHENDYIVDAFWVLSNLVDSVPNLLMPHFDASFVSETINITSSGSSNFELKKEAAFFLGTLIIYTEFTDLSMFFVPELIEVFIEMLGAGVPLLVIRTLDAFLRLEQAAAGGFIKADTQLLQDEELQSAVRELAEKPQQMIQDKASCLANLLGEIKDSPLLG